MYGPMNGKLSNLHSIISEKAVMGIHRDMDDNPRM
jgi:hypothetical protein